MDGSTVATVISQGAFLVDIPDGCLYYVSAVESSIVTLEDCRSATDDPQESLVDMASLLRFVQEGRMRILQRSVVGQFESSTGGSPVNEPEPRRGL